MTEPKYLGDLPMDEEQAYSYALRWIRAKFGQNPYVQGVQGRDNLWEVKVAAEYPKLIVDPITSRPRQPLYYQFDNVALLTIDRTSGQLVQKTHDWAVHSKIKAGLEEIHESVEKAVTKVGAEPLSRLPFGEHMHTPMTSIISWLLLNQKLDFEEEEFIETEEAQVRVRDYLAKLEKVGIVRVEGKTAVPGNVLVEIFARSEPDHQKVRAAMAYFFSRGYDDIETVRQVVGPYLHLARIVFEDSIEMAEQTPISYKTVVQRFTESTYGEKKKFQLPRYLVQLADVGLIEDRREGAETVYVPPQQWFQRVLSQDTLLEPLHAHLNR